MSAAESAAINVADRAPFPFGSVHREVRTALDDVPRS